jgi:hypothetical protein
MDQILDLALLHFPNLEEMRKVTERYVPSKLALAHSAVVAFFVGTGDCGYFTALLLLLWILAASVFSGGLTLLKQWPTEPTGTPVLLATFIENVRNGDEVSRFLAIRGAVSASAFFGFAYLLGQPFQLLGLYFPFFALLIFSAATGLAARLGYTDRLREAADKDKKQE